MTGHQRKGLWISAAMAVGALTLSWLASGVLFGQRSKTNGVATVELKLKLSKSDFILSEDREMTVTVRNRTSGPVEIPNPFHSDNWQPVYTITGPSYPHGYTFSFRSVALKDSRPEPTGVPAVTVTLAPGETLEHDVPLHDWAPIQEPGYYQIVARLSWKGLTVQSEPVRFNIASPKALSASVGVDVGIANTPGEWVEWFHDSASSRQLYTALFERPHVDVHGYKPFSISPLIQAGSQATDLFSPWANYNRMSELAKWRAWREGSAIVAFALGQKQPQRVELGALPGLLVHPALMTSKGELDVFAIGADGALMLVRFPDFRGDSSSARVLWRVHVPQVPVAGRAALSSEALGSQRRVVLVSRDGEDLGVHYLNAWDGSKPGSWASVRIPRAMAIPNTEPGLRVGADGSAYAAFPILMQTGRLAIADLHFNPGGQLEGEPRITELDVPDVHPKAAAASYMISADGAMRRDWVVLLENGNVICSATPSPSHRLPAVPVMPLNLVVLSSGAYLLTIDASGAPGLTLLD